jgi:hypothetical protein
VDLDLWGQNTTFFFQAFFDKICDVFVKNGILRSAIQFREVELDLWGQNSTFFFQAFFWTNFLCLCAKTAFRKVLNDFTKWI